MLTGPSARARESSHSGTPRLDLTRKARMCCPPRCPQVLRVPSTWQHQIDLSCLSIRSKPYSDQDRSPLVLLFAPKFGLV